jgi:ABC-type antimicrobial peptide transport system permease subunit
MISFALDSLKFNKKKYSIVALLSTVGFSFIYFILQVLGHLMKEDVASDDNSFIVLMVAFVAVFIVCVYMSISVVIHIFYKMRKNELYILKTLGASKKKIRRMYKGELIILGLIISIISFFVGLVITNAFLNYYDMKTSINLEMVALFFIISNFVFVNIGSIQFKKVFKELTPKVKNKKKKKTNYVLQGIVGIIFIVTSLFMNHQEITVITMFIGIGILINPVLFLIINVLRLIFDFLKIPHLSVSLKQVLFNFKKIILLTKNIAISIALIVMMFTLYHSLRSSGVQYSSENMKFDSLIQLENPVQDFTINKDKVFNGLTLNGELNKNNKKVLIAGINEDYLGYENLDFANGNISELKKTGTELSCIIPELLRINNGFKIGDVIQAKVLDKSLKLKIVGSIYTYNLSEIYVSKDTLSESMFNTANISNVFYVKGDQAAVLNQLSKIGASKPEVIARDTLIQEYKAGILNGTEMIETFLYVYLAISVFLIINMFLMSVEEKSRYNGAFITLGLRKSKVIFMSIIEGIVTVILGSLLGIIIGGILIQGLPMFTLASYGVRIAIYIPNQFLMTVILVTQLITIVSILILSIFTTNGKTLKLVGKEE